MLSRCSKERLRTSASTRCSFRTSITGLPSLSQRPAAKPTLDSFSSTLTTIDTFPLSFQGQSVNEASTFPLITINSISISSVISLCISIIQHGKETGCYNERLMKRLSDISLAVNGDCLISATNFLMRGDCSSLKDAGIMDDINVDMYDISSSSNL